MPRAANLATACELTGDDGKALAWVRKGIERNPKADGGTEWLHARILEAKLALKDNPKWLESHSVLGPRDSSWQVEISVVGNRGEPLSPKQVKTALIYQLRERLQFTSPPDAIVGSLLLDLGELLSGDLSEVGGAYDVFKLAGDYLEGLPNVEPLQIDVERAERKVCGAVWAAISARGTPRRRICTPGRRRYSPVYSRCWSSA